MRGPPLAGQAGASATAGQQAVGLAQWLGPCPLRFDISNNILYGHVLEKLPALLRVVPASSSELVQETNRINYTDLSDEGIRRTVSHLRNGLNM